MGPKHAEDRNPRRPGPGGAGLRAALVPAVLGPAWVVLAGRLLPGQPLATLAGLVLLLTLTACAYTDLTRRRIPNWATYTAVLWALVLNAAAAWIGPRPWLGAVGIVESLLGLGACFLVLLMIYRASGSGAGDVKLAGAIGALLGPERGLNALVLTYLAAGVAIGAWAVWTVGPIRLFGGLARRVGSWAFPGRVARPSADQEQLLRRSVPLAPFFGIGTFFALQGLDLR